MGELPSDYPNEAQESQSPHPEQEFIQRERILLVEDDESLRRMFRIFLEISGYEVIESPDGQDALDKVLAIYMREHQKKDKFNLIVSDNKMPGKTGIEFARQLRRIEEEKGFTAQLPPILFISASIDDYEVEEMKRLGDGYMKKSFGLKEFEQTVASHLKDKPHGNSSQPTPIFH